MDTVCRFPSVPLLTLDVTAAVGAPASGGVRPAAVGRLGQPGGCGAVQPGGRTSNGRASPAPAEQLQWRRHRITHSRLRGEWGWSPTAG